MTDDFLVDSLERSSQAGRGSPSLIALILGLSAGLPMYLWQGLTPAVSTLMIVGYTGWLWAATARHFDGDGSIRSDLRQLPINAPWRRVRRMLFDAAFWWSLIFGATMVAGSLWYVGLHDTLTISLLAGAWSLIAVCLGYGTSLLQPTTRCRSCGYQLISQLHASEGERVRCPECGRKWSRRDLGIELSRGPVQLRRAA